MEPGSCPTPRFPLSSHSPGRCHFWEPAHGPHRVSEPLVREVGVPLRHPGVGVTEQQLGRPQVAKAHLDITGERVAQIVEAEVGDPALPEDRRPHPS